jgi:hypothetical protein
VQCATLRRSFRQYVPVCQALLTAAKLRTSAVTLDPVATNPDHYTVVFENDRVRVLEYLDHPGHRTTPHDHPDSVMYTLSTFRRRLYAPDGQTRDVEIAAGTSGWLPAQQHAGHNIGDTDTHVIFVELKEPATGQVADAVVVGPTAGV